jgi:signal transduction histidine kinase
MTKTTALDPLGGLFHVVPDLATPSQVQSSLREVLDDATLELFWWDWEAERYVDVDGATAELEEQPGRALTRVDYESRKIGALVHDPKLLERRDFVGTFVPAMRIAMERDRLHRDLVGKLEQLRSSRQRMVEAADAERRRLERNLHDGAQQRLIVVLLGLRGLERRVADDPELAALVAAARAELEGALEDLRELARGLHPPLLAQRGLAAAVRAGAARSSLPIDLELELDEALPPAVEAAAYYVCAEAVTNAVKHARASRAAIRIVHAGGVLSVEVRDDGVGGACVEGEGEGEASGLGGLKDRVEALGGRFEVESPAGRGTVLRAGFPV